MSELINAVNLGFRPGNRYILHDISWQVHSGEHWVLFGLNGIGTTNTHGYHTETAGVWGMGVSTHHHTSREGKPLLDLPPRQTRQLLSERT